MRGAVAEVCDQPYRTVVAESFLDALLGVHGVSPDVEALVIPGNSVHGLTLRKPIWVFGVDGSGDGVGGRRLRRGRIVRFAGAKHVVEIVHGLACDGEHLSHTIRWSG